MRRAAVERVQALFAKHLLKAEVLDALRTDPTLKPQLRAAALEIAERRTENASGLYEVAWLTIVRPIGTPEDNRLALKRLEAACRVVADDPDRLAEYRRALPLRSIAGRFAPALEALQSQAGKAPGRPTSPLDLAVTAMASQRLGKIPDARAALDGLRALPEERPPGQQPGSARIPPGGRGRRGVAGQAVAFRSSNIRFLRQVRGFLIPELNHGLHG